MLDLVAIKKDIESAHTLTELESKELLYLGRNGLINEHAVKLKTLIGEERKKFGISLNEHKKAISTHIADKKYALVAARRSQLVDFDTTLPGITPHIGHLHPTTLAIREMVAYFTRLGYSVYEGPEIETDEFNFNKMNLPVDHPARDLQDTLYISEPEWLLRTHTSSVEARCMTQEKLPIRMIVPGKCYRNESTNMTNNAIFYQLEGLVIDKGINMGHLKATLEEFAKHMYGSDVVTRFRCKYYPQVEPGAGMDIQCRFCGGAGCQTCKYRGWIEALGSGIVHPQVLRNCGIDPTIYSGFAFGMGLDRLVMMKWGINDIRSLYNGELVWKN
ncbi:MAG: phenylalanine--tRNA ligase subunit alpha [Candidatus Roizmanbacteria bacterium]